MSLICIGFLKFGSIVSCKILCVTWPPKLLSWFVLPAAAVELRLYVDADFAGDRLTGKSTSGRFLILYGPSTFFPLAWVSKRQTSTSRSTTESEVVSLAHSLYQEGLPALQLWERHLATLATWQSL